MTSLPWRHVCQFLSGAFFVSAGVLFYLWLYRIPMPIFRTGLVQSPEVAGWRSLVHFVLWIACFYAGFIRKWNPPRATDDAPDAP